MSSPKPTKDNATRFLQAMTAIEDFLKEQDSRSTTSDQHLEFKPLIKSSRNLVHGQKSKLIKYVELRNSIVHTPRDPFGNAIADPREDVVIWVKEQLIKLTKPPFVYETLKLQKPRVLKDDENLSDFLTLVRDNDFSQSPVRGSQGSLWLITTNAVTRWIASEYARDQGALLDSSTIAEMKAFTEDGDSLYVASRNLTAVQAVRIFAGEQIGNPPAAIVLTDSGSYRQTPLGICSRADVARLLEALGV